MYQNACALFDPDAEPTPARVAPGYAAGPRTATDGFGRRTVATARDLGVCLMPAEVPLASARYWGGWNLQSD